MESIVLTSKIWSPQHFLLRDGVQKYTHESPSTQHLVIKDRIYDIYSLEMDLTSIIHERWSAQNLLMRNGENGIN